MSSPCMCVYASAMDGATILNELVPRMRKGEADEGRHKVTSMVGSADRIDGFESRTVK